MRVVVWQSYGEIDVYAADTPGELASVVGLMIDAVAGWHLEAVTDLARRKLVSDPVSAFNMVRNAINPGSHESFEVIQIKEVK